MSMRNTYSIEYIKGTVSSTNFIHKIPKQLRTEVADNHCSGLHRQPQERDAHQLAMGYIHCI